MGTRRFQKIDPVDADRSRLGLAVPGVPREQFLDYTWSIVAERLGLLPMGSHVSALRPTTGPGRYFEQQRIAHLIDEPNSDRDWRDAIRQDIRSSCCRALVAFLERFDDGTIWACLLQSAWTNLATYFDLADAAAAGFAWTEFICPRCDWEVVVNDPLADAGVLQATRTQPSVVLWADNVLGSAPAGMRKRPDKQRT